MQFYNQETIKRLLEKQNISVKLSVRLYKFIYRLETIEGSNRVLRVVARNEYESEYFIKKAIECGIVKFKRTDLYFFEKQICGKEKQKCLSEYLRYLEIFGDYKNEE